METTKIIRILDRQAGRYTEETVQPHSVTIDESQIPYPRNGKGRITVNHEEVLQEAGGQLHTANFPDLLRMGIQFDAFTSYTETPTTYQQFVRTVDSNKQQEEYLFDSAIGLLPIVPEGSTYPEASTDLDSGLIIRNFKRGMIVSVTEEMQMFDQVGKVRELGELMGRAARLGEEQSVMDVITTSGNYTRNSSTGDNDEGANTASTTFSGTGLITAFNTLRTMKDRKTGVYLNVMPDTLIMGPKLWWAARQLLFSPEVMRVGDAGSASDVYGTGTTNSFFNAIRTVIVSPQFSSSYAWCMMEARRAVTFQRVAPIQVLLESMGAQTTGYFERDVIRYRVRNWYGVGMRDDRFAFLSTSSSTPAVS